jgi:hypothetical protein
MASPRKGGARSVPAGTATSSPTRDVDVQVGTAKDVGAGRTVTGEERARLWENALEFWPPYADYQRKTEREIPVVVLDAATTRCGAVTCTWRQSTERCRYQVSAARHECVARP